MALNKDEIVKKLKKKESVTVEVPTSDPNLLAHIRIKPNGTGGAKLTGYPMQASPKVKKDDKTMQRTAKSINNIDLHIRSLASSIEDRYKKRQKGVRQKILKSNGTITIVDKLRSIEEELLEPGNYIEYTSKRWALSTTEATVKYLICSIAPAMDRYGDDICEEDMKKIKEELIAHAAASARGKVAKDGTRNPKDIEIVESGFENRFRRAGIIYKWVLEHRPELKLPDVEFIKSLKEKKHTAEKAKALPEHIRVRLANLIFLLCSMGVSLAFGVALEFFCGLRVGEAAAPLIGELILITNDTSFIYGKYYVQFQIDDKGNRTPYLKREASKRYVPLTSAMVRIVQMRIDQLKAAGFSDDQIIKMPFVAYNNDPMQFVAKDKLAEFAKSLLIMAGCSAEYLEEAAKMMYIHPEYDEQGKALLDITSHLCRRDYATRMKGHCSALELDEILGHENPGNSGKDYASDDTMRRLAREAEVSFVFDTNLTQNPAFQPIQMSDNKDIHLIGNLAYCFQNPTDRNIVIDFDLLSLEPNDSMLIKVGSDAQIKHLRRRTPSDTKSSCRGRRIRNRLIDVETIRIWKEEVEDIDLSSLLKKYDR